MLKILYYNLKAPEADGEVASSPVASGVIIATSGAVDARASSWVFTSIKSLRLDSICPARTSPASTNLMVVLQDRFVLESFANCNFKLSESIALLRGTYNYI
jgi:hypothetical protein